MSIEASLRCEFRSLERVTNCGRINLFTGCDSAEKTVNKLGDFTSKLGFQAKAILFWGGFII